MIKQISVCLMTLENFFNEIVARFQTASILDFCNDLSDCQI